MPKKARQMMDYRERLELELKRIIKGVVPNDKLSSMGLVRFTVRCNGNGNQVLRNVKEVLSIVVKQSLSISEWPSDDEWAGYLPGWFTNRFAEPLTQEAAEKWLKWWKSLSQEEQARVEKESQWSLPNWIYWFQPDNRTWHWWDGACFDDYSCSVEIEVAEWPFPWGALRWLFRAAGAEEIESE